MRRVRSLSGGHVPVVVLIAAASAAFAADAVRLSDPSRQKDWQDGLAALSEGQFDEAARRIHGVAESESSPQVKRVNEWLSSFERLQTDREKRIKDDYDTYVQWVKEEAAKGEWRSAIWHCGLAFNNAQDQEAFRKEPWLLKVGSSRVDLQACKLEYSIVSPK